MHLHHMTLVKYLHHRPSLVACVLALLVLLRPAPVHAQSANDGFDPGPNGVVYDVATQADGRILVAGGFSSIAGTNRSFLARLNVDGSVDAQFHPTVGAFPGDDLGRAVAVAVQADGKILVGGEVIFADTTTGGPGGYIIAGLGRLHPDGTTDTNFIPRLASGPFGGTWSVWHIAAQPDGKVVIAGDFTTSSGGINPASTSARTNLARLNPDGSVDASFDPRNTGSIYNLLLQRDGKILVSGLFTSLGGHPSTNLARFNPDGSFDETFRPVIGGVLTGLGQQADGKIIVGGTFTLPGSPANTNLVRLNPNGTTDQTFPAALGGRGSRVAVQPDGKILVGGTFTSLNGQARTNLARLLPDGTLDTTFNPGANGTVRTLAVQGDGKILAGGGFTTVAGTARTNLGRLYVDGSVDATLVASISGGLDDVPSKVLGLALEPSGSILVAGNFATVAMSARNGLARLYPDGSIDSIVNPDADLPIVPILYRKDRQRWIGGNFTTLGGQPHSRLARLLEDGTVDGGFTPLITNVAGISVLGVINLREESDGRVLVGGAFTQINGITRSNLARLNPDGSVDLAFNPTIGGEVRALTLQTDGRILIGGEFSSVAGQARSRLARLNPDGTLDGSFNPGADGTVFCLLMRPDGKIIVGGRFNTIGGLGRSRLARLESDGTVDASFNAGTWTYSLGAPFVATLALQSNWRIIAGGSFNSIAGQTRNHLARFTDVGTLDATFNPNPNGRVWGLALQSDGKLIVGGEFSSLAGLPRIRLARLTLDGTAAQSLSLSADGTSVQWHRVGIGPEVESVTFEQSNDGTNYARMSGAIEWLPGAWRISTVSIPAGQSLFVKASGTTRSGLYNASSGLIESVAQFWRLPPPFLNNVQVLGGGQFQFSFTNTNATAFSVLASTNAAAPLAQWESLGAPVSVGGGTYQFTDPGATNHARRFYQLRSP